MLCLHLGPGPLGLGLVVDVLRDLELDVCLMGAPGRDPPEAHQYELSFIDPEIGLITRDVAWACNPRSAGDLDGEVLDRLDAREEMVLITCALGDEAGEREALLDELLERRPRGAHTSLLACENEAHPAYERVAARHPHVHYCACVVDRICNRKDPERDEEGRRRFVVHPVAQWVIQTPEDDAARLVDCLDRSAVTLFVDGSLDGYDERKLWAVNGVHTLLALMARQDGLDRLPLEGARASAFRAVAQPMIATILETVHRRHPTIPPDPKFAADRVRAFCETPDYTTRILRGRLKRSDLREFMRRLNARVGEAARAAHDCGVSCELFESAIDVVVETVTRRRAYIDDDPAMPTAATDAEVVEALKRVLAGWLAPDRAEHVVSRLERWLAITREPR